MKIINLIYIKKSKLTLNPHNNSTLGNFPKFMDKFYNKIK